MEPRWLVRGENPNTKRPSYLPDIVLSIVFWYLFIMLLAFSFAVSH